MHWWRIFRKLYENEGRRLEYHLITQRKYLQYLDALPLVSADVKVSQMNSSILALTWDTVETKVHQIKTQVNTSESEGELHDGVIECFGKA